MKLNIHPNYNAVLVKCACGHEFHIYSSIDSQSINTEICNACHPVYTGQQKTATMTGRVETFNRKFQQRPQPKAVEPVVATKKVAKQKVTKKITIKKSTSDK